MPRCTEAQAREAVTASYSYAETLRRLGLCASGGNWLTLRRWTETWSISTAHFDRNRASVIASHERGRPLDEILKVGSSYSRRSLKQRLWATGVKPRHCELCGQGETWHGRPMGLILDHVNGVRDDHRLENLRIVCPNCAATLDTHCGRRNAVAEERICPLCHRRFRPNRPEQRYCSQACGTRAPRAKGRAQPARRRIDRPSHEQLMREVAETNWSSVGSRYGVSAGAIRKWMRQYESEAQPAPVAEGDPTRREMTP